jgi:hypothetical protein
MIVSDTLRFLRKVMFDNQQPTVRARGARRSPSRLRSFADR